MKALKIVVYLGILFSAGWIGCGSNESADRSGVDKDSNNPENPPQQPQIQALQLEEEHVQIQGKITLEIDELEPADISVALRWVIPDGPYPTQPVTSSVERKENDGEGLFSIRTDIIPPPEALVPNEANEAMEGFAVAYIIAFVDGNNNGALDCRSPRLCDDVYVGAAPNVLVVYHQDGWPAEGPPAFAFTPDAQLRPPRGWSLVHLAPSACEERPQTRAWRDNDLIDLIVIGDFATQNRCEVRAIQPDVD